MIWKKVLLGLFLLSSGLALGACGQASTVEPAPTSLPASSARARPELPNLLVQAEGKIWLRRAGWSDFLPVSLGIVIAPGDMLRVAEGSTAAVFCGDESLWEQGPSSLQADGLEHGIPCQVGRPPRPWSDVAALRGEEDNQVPYVLYPRNTALLNDRPRLQWHPLPGVDTYTLTLIADDGQDRAAVQASGGGLDWPEDWPPLEPRATYVLVVEGDGKLSDAGNQGHAGLGFWLLATGEAQTVQELEARLRALPMAATARDLLVAELYLEHGLYAEAVPLLEGLATDDGPPAAWLALGQVHLELGLALEAQAALDQALAIAQATGQQEAEAAAQVGLGLAAQLLDDDAAAENHLQAARERYEQFGDQDGVEQVERLLSQ
jgi:hypothetical protein